MRAIRSRGSAALGCALVAAGATLAVAPATAEEGSQFRPPVRSEAGVVATEAPAASRVAVKVLNRGGNAVDAATAAAVAMTAARPQSCGIGGGGFMVYRRADGQTSTLDFRETAPARMNPNTFQRPGPHEAFTGHLTVGVPSLLAGVKAALGRHGTISLDEAIRPTERLAKEGINVRPSLSEAMARQEERLKLYPPAARHYLIDGDVPYPPGSTLRNKGLGITLHMIRERGLDTFYEGVIADRIVRDMKDAGEVPGDRGIMRRPDIASYEAEWRKPLSSRYRNSVVTAMPPPTSGGIAVIEMLNILEGFDLARFGQSSTNALHYIAEAEKIAFADRDEYVGDPAYTRVPTKGLTGQRYARERRREIERNVAQSYEPGDFRGGGRAAGRDSRSDGDTTHISVIDRRGNAVSLTCTIEFEFGSAVMAPRTGFMLNNELTDFSDPGTANEPEPGKRPRSSMSPTIVTQDGEPTLAIGGAGGPTIIMGSLLGVVNLVDFDRNIAHAVDAERVDEMFGPPFRMSLENARVSPQVQAELTARGHQIVPMGEYGTLPRVQAVGVNPRSGKNEGVADPRTDNGARAQR